jgi:hypothetical protein
LSSSVRSRSVKTREEIPATFFRNTPNRVGPFVLRAQRMCIVHGRVNTSSSPLIAHGD